MNAVYPGAKQVTPGSITIANGKTQMDFAGFTFLLDGPGAEGWPPSMLPPVNVPRWRARFQKHC